MVFVCCYRKENDFCAFHDHQNFLTIIWEKKATMIFIINNLIKGLIPLGFFIWSIFMPKTGSYTFIGIYIALQAYLFFIDSNKPNPDPSKLSTDGIDIIRIYHLALSFPSGANIMSIQLNGFRWIGLFLFTPWLLLNHMWITAAVTVICFFVTGSITVRLDPFFFISDSVKNGNMQFVYELELLNEVSERLSGRAT